MASWTTYMVISDVDCLCIHYMSQLKWMLFVPTFSKYHSISVCERQWQCMERHLKATSSAYQHKTVDEECVRKWYFWSKWGRFFRDFNFPIDCTVSSRWKVPIAGRESGLIPVIMVPERVHVVQRRRFLIYPNNMIGLWPQLVGPTKKWCVCRILQHLLKCIPSYSSGIPSSLNGE